MCIGWQRIEFPWYWHGSLCDFCPPSVTESWNNTIVLTIANEKMGGVKGGMKEGWDGEVIWENGGFTVSAAATHTHTHTEEWVRAQWWCQDGDIGGNGWMESPHPVLTGVNGCLAIWLSPLGWSGHRWHVSSSHQRVKLQPSVPFYTYAHTFQCSHTQTYTNIHTQTSFLSELKQHCHHNAGLTYKGQSHSEQLTMTF